MWLPDADGVTSIHLELVDLFAESEDPISPPGVKNKALLESACARPLTGIGDTDKYATVYAKAAALFHSLVKNHPFHNGNKRTALVAMLTALHRNDLILCPHVTDDDVFDFTLAVTADEFPTAELAAQGADSVVEGISHWLRDNTERLEPNVTSMLVSEFIEKCERAGASVKKVSGGRSYNIASPHGGVTFQTSIRKLDGGVIRNFMKRLGYTQSKSGVSAGEFQGGMGSERDEIHRFMAALRRLAKT